MTLPGPDLPPPADADPATKKKRSGLVWAGVVVMVISVCMGIGGVVGVIMPLVEAASGPTMFVPGSKVFTLEPGTYSIYEETGSSGSFTRSRFTTISPADIEVTSPNGTELSVTRLTSTQTIEDEGNRYTAVAQFGATSKGSYAVDIESDETTRVKIAPSIDEDALVTWGLVMFGGGALFVVGLILLIIGLVRSSREAKRNRPPPYGMGPGPGYGPPGYGPPGYGPPGYGPPGYPPPGYGPPGYAPPGYGPPGAPPGAPPPGYGPPGGPPGPTDPAYPPARPRNPGATPPPGGPGAPPGPGRADPWG